MKADPNSIDLYWMQIAHLEALKAKEENEVPVGCVLVSDQKLISQAYNQKETKADPTSHAEMTCIRSACKKTNSWRLSQATLYVTLEPCMMCLGAIIQARIKRLVCGSWDSKRPFLFNEESPHQFQLPSLSKVNKIMADNHHLEVCGPVMVKENEKLLKDFFKMRRKQNKNTLTTL